VACDVPHDEVKRVAAYQRRLQTTALILRSGRRPCLEGWPQTNSLRAGFLLLHHALRRSEQELVDAIVVHVDHFDAPAVKLEIRVYVRRGLLPADWAGDVDEGNMDLVSGRADPGFRGACHRASHFGPDPLAATSG
jgi:hypothetical protein